VVPSIPAFCSTFNKASASVGEVEHVLYQQSGLLGVSGLSGDMRVLLASEAALHDRLSLPR